MHFFEITLLQGARETLDKIGPGFMIVVQLGLGLLFFTAGISKRLRARSIQLTVANYRLVPLFALPFVAAVLSPAEIAGGGLLVASLWLPVFYTAWGLATGLVLGFTIAVGTALARGLRIPCGCGLLLNGHVITWATLGRNLTILLLLTVDFLLH